MTFRAFCAGCSDRSSPTTSSSANDAGGSSAVSIASVGATVAAITAGGGAGATRFLRDVGAVSDGVLRPLGLGLAAVQSLRFGVLDDDDDSGGGAGARFLYRRVYAFSALAVDANDDTLPYSCELRCSGDGVMAGGRWWPDGRRCGSGVLGVEEAALRDVVGGCLRGEEMYLYLSMTVWGVWGCGWGCC